MTSAHIEEDRERIVCVCVRERERERERNEPKACFSALLAKTWLDAYKIEENKPRRWNVNRQEKLRAKVKS